MFLLFASTSDVEQVGLQLHMSLESVQCHLWSPQSSGRLFHRMCRIILENGLSPNIFNLRNRLQSSTNGANSYRQSTYSLLQCLKLCFGIQSKTRDAAYVHITAQSSYILHTMRLHTSLQVTQVYISVILICTLCLLCSVISRKLWIGLITMSTSTAVCRSANSHALSPSTRLPAIFHLPTCIRTYSFEKTTWVAQTHRKDMFTGRLKSML